MVHQAIVIYLCKQAKNYADQLLAKVGGKLEVPHQKTAFDTILIQTYYIIDGIGCLISLVQRKGTAASAKVWFKNVK
jgi:hypothetical protein